MSDDYTNEQYKALNYSVEQFDKSVLFIASGALGISFAFVEKIVPDLKNAFCKGLLISSWYFFAGVIFISLVAHFISILAIRWSIKNDPDNNKKYKKIENCWNWSIRALNVLMIIGLFAGIILLILFIKLNIK